MARAETLRLDAFMQHANAAYYATQNPYADFTTAPEISQVFGELLGLWAAIAWAQAGRPDPVIFAEAGPGRGSLMADALRAIRQMVPDFAQALRLHLVEASPRLRAIQAARLPEAIFHDHIDTLPDGALLLLANEFFDALPIRQFLRRDGAWLERHVIAGAPAWQPTALPDDFTPGDAAPDGAIWEYGGFARGIMRGLATRIVAQGGAALLLDYGPAASLPGDSLQALRAGAPALPWNAPGSADLTAHVDFQALAQVAHAAGAAVYGPLAQGRFLLGLGLMPRSLKLARGQAPAAASATMAAAQRLSAPDQMGSLFKALALTPRGQDIPPGFAQDFGPAAA